MGRGNPYYYRYRGSEEMHALGGGVIARNVEFAQKKILTGKIRVEKCTQSLTVITFIAPVNGCLNPHCREGR